MKSTLHMLTLLALLSPALALDVATVRAQDVAPQPDAPLATTPPSAPEVTTPPAAPAALATPPDTASAAELYVAHAPVSETTLGELTLSFSVSPIDRVEAVLVRWRTRTPGATVHEVTVGRVARGWVAEIRDAEIAPPGIVYWVVRRDPGAGPASEREHPVFASEREPHPVVVVDDEVASYERRMLAQRAGRRYRAGATVEYVNLGSRNLPDGMSGPRTASYTKLGIQFSYAFFGIVDEIRFSAGRLMGSEEYVTPGAPTADANLGLNWGGGELVFRAHDLVRIRSGILFGVSQTGFELGGNLALVIGEPEGTSLEIGGEGVTGLGGTGRLRLGWATVPHVPMGATIELTNFATNDAAGVRLLFDASYAFYTGALLRVTAGYRGWTSTVGGPSLAADLLFAF
jgi:hypothetical protein